MGRRSGGGGKKFDPAEGGRMTGSALAMDVVSGLLLGENFIRMGRRSGGGGAKNSTWRRVGG